MVAVAHTPVAPKPDNSIINALKRLERAGGEHGRATEKLLDAAWTTATHIENIIMDAQAQNVALPRGYRVERRRIGYCNRCYCGGGTYSALLRNNTPINGEGIYAAGNDNCLYCEAGTRGYATLTRATAMAFAKDIASGWLDELDAFLRKRSADSDSAVATLVAVQDWSPGDPDFSPNDTTQELSPTV